MKSFPTTQTIESWLAGELPEAEAQSLSELEQEDTDFAELVAYHRLAFEAIEAGLGAHLKQHLQSLNPSEKQSIQQEESVSTSAIPIKPSIRPFWRRATTWGIAATLALLFAMSLWMLNTHSDQSLARQFADAYAAPPVRGELGPEELVNQGLEAYQDERYEAAIEAFLQLPTDHPRYLEMHFYLGNSALQLGEAQRAIQAFQLVLMEKDVRFAPAAEWYLALAYLQDGQVQKAKRSALRLSEDAESAYQEQAKQLLEKMGSSWRW